jgi:hypothetical protein
MGFPKKWIGSGVRDYHKNPTIIKVFLSPAILAEVNHPAGPMSK